MTGSVTTTGSGDRLGPLDVWFLHLEDRDGLLHVGSVLIFDGPMPPYQELHATLAQRLARTPRHRQVIRPVTLALNRPIWVDDPNFDLDFHLRHTALPAPGDLLALRKLFGRVMSQRLDRRHPLWEVWVVEGLHDGSWAVISKAHHCMVDGIAGADMTLAMLDPTKDTPPLAEQPVRASSDGSRGLVRNALADHLRTALGGATSTVGAVGHPLRSAKRMAGVVRGATGLAGLLRPVPPSSLTGPIGPHRRWSWAEADLAQVKQIRQTLGGTVNDVVLAAVTSGFRQLLVDRSETEAVVRCLIPVSTRATDDRGNLDNRVTALFATLPTHETDPLARYRAVQKEMDAMKRSGEPQAASMLVEASGYLPPLILGPAMRLTSEVVDRVGQRFVTTVVTNIPGPQQTLHLMGRRLRRWVPYVPVAEGLRIGIAALSYDGVIAFGVTGEWSHADDLVVLTAGIEAGLAELADVADQAVGLEALDEA